MTILYSMKELFEIECNKCKAEFEATYPLLPSVLDSINGYYAELFNLIKNHLVDNSALGYQYGLIVSFIRSSITIENLILNGMNIEAICLIRKQLELLARLEELNEKNYSELIHKTPNMKYVGEKKRTYSQLSEISHSSVRETLHLLGIAESNVGVSIGLSITPIFDKNLIISMNYQIDLFFSFFSWIEQSVIKNISKDKFSHDCKWIYEEFIPKGVKSKVPYFDRFKNDME